MTLQRTALARELFEAFESGVTTEPLTARHPDLRVDDAYRIQRELLALHAARGRRVVGRKIGLTSRAIQEQLGVNAPDYGAILDGYVLASGRSISRSTARLLAPRVEPELAFVLATPLRGPGITADDVLAVTAHILPVMEVIDSRIVDWRIGLADTIADNASCYGVVAGDPILLGQAGELAAVEVALARDGEVLLEGSGAAVLGHPAEAVAWLANALAAHGDELPADEIVLSGSFTAALDATPGVYTATFSGEIGAVQLEITR